MRVAQVFAHVLVALLLVWLGVGNARAQNVTVTASREEAWTQCNAYGSAQADGFCKSMGYFGTGNTFLTCVRDRPEPYREYRPEVQCHNHQTQATVTTRIGMRFTWPEVECPTGSVWNEASKTCFSSERCLAMAPRAGGWYIGSAAMCHDGCEFDNPTDRQTFTAGGVTYKSLGGSKPTGQPCAPSEDTKPLPEQPQYCQQMGSQTVCLKSDTGEQCYSASTGRQICWKPGETGEKPDLNVLQKRNAGPNEIPPTNVNLPSGDQLQKSGDSATTTSTRTTNNTTTTTTTTTTNYTTVNGTNVGSGNKGESGSGDGSGKEDDGEGDGSASGGDTCAAAPSCSGDPIACATLTQTWRNRCDAEGRFKGIAEEAKNMDQSDGSADHSDAVDQLWSTETGEFQGDEGGFGFGRSCPPPPEILGHTLDFSRLCEVMGYVGMLVLVMAHVHALYIVAGD